MLLTFNSFSQTDTSRFVILSEDVARKVVSDLIKGDWCQVQVLELNKKIDLLESRANLQSDVVRSQNFKIENLNESKTLLNRKIESNNIYIERLQKDLKRSQNREKIYKVAAGVLLATTVIYTITL